MGDSSVPSGSPNAKPDLVDGDSVVSNNASLETIVQSFQDSMSLGKRHKFWETQPVGQYKDVGDASLSEGPIEPPTPLSEVKQEPYNLPNAYEWTTCDMESAETCDEVYVLLKNNYVEDDENMFRFNYSKEFLSWALRVPGYYRSWHIGVRAKASKKLVAFISGVPARIRVNTETHINNLPLLLTFLSPSSPPHHVLESLLSLHSFFLPLLPKLPSSSSSAAPSAADQSEFIYLTWLRSKFDEFLKSLLDILASPQSDETLKELVLDTLMEFVKVANGGAFHSALYHKLLLSIVRSTSPATFFVDLLESKYFKYIDVRYFTYISLKKLATTLEGKDASDDKIASADGPNESQLSSNMECFIHNMYYTISHVPPLQGSNNTSDLEMWSSSESPPSESDHKQLSGDVSVDDKLLKSKKPNKNVLSAAKIAKKMKLKFTKAWIAFLRLPLPLDVYKEVLVNLHQAVIPHLSNPIMLCDFLTRSYDVGGVVSVMALSSLFVLMTQYGLEYPNFYEKLYALLVPSTFMAKHRARFFQLLDSCLKSPLLPAYLAASFAKKLSRLLLSVPPSGALVITALIHNILRRHPSVNCLVHREDGVDEGKSDHRTDEGSTANSDNVKTSAIPCQKPGIDHFNSIETDPKKSAAMRSSLWEIDTILHHYCPPVSRFALSLGNDLTVRAKTSEVNVGDFSAGSYATILGAEIRRRVKQVPLAFYKASSSSLFSETDFAGWTFKCEEIPEMTNGNNERSTKDLS